MRGILLVLVMFIIILVCFLIWGEWFEGIFSQEGTISFLDRYGSWAGLVAIGLLMADLFLPLPGTIIMSALGFIYGSFWGGVIASVGGLLSGLLAYILCRSLGAGMAVRLLGSKDFARGQTLFANQGGWIVAVSRWLPMVPEVVACMAGLNRMSFRAFCLALACGAIPLGFTFAAIGAMGWQHPEMALALSALLPIPLWFVSNHLLRRKIDSAKSS